MKLKIFATAVAILFCVSSANAFEMPKPDSQMLKDAWGKVTDVTNGAVNYVTGKGDNSENNKTSETSSQESIIFSKIWKKFSEVSNDAIKLATDSDKKSRTMIEFLTAREPKYVRLLKKAQKILAESEAREQFEKIDELTLKNKDNQETIIKLKSDKVTAPSSSYNPIATTKERIDKKIANLETEIEDNKVKIEHLKSEIISILKKNGLTISPDELNYFIVSAEGSELVRLMAIANNTKKIQSAIEQELLQDKNNVNLAKYYTGMYLISLETYSSAHDIALEKILEYRKKVKMIVQDADRNREEAKKLRISANNGDLANIDANIIINERVITVAKMYDELLRKRIDLLKQSKSNVEKKVRIATNTYKTIMNGSSLISLVNTESGEFSLLVNFEMPELKMIYDSAMLNAFIEISDRIKAEK